MKDLYLKLKLLFKNPQDIEVKNIISILKSIEKIQFISSLQRDLYNDPNFHSNFKLFIKNNIKKLDIELFHIFNILFYIEVESINSSLDYFFSNNVNPTLIKRLFSGNIKYHPDILKNYYIKNKIDEQYKLIFMQFFLARNYKFDEIKKIFGIHSQQQQIKNKKINVALLISGQVRGIEAALQSWKKCINLENTNLDVFLSTWNKSGHATKVDWNRIGFPEDADNIKKNYINNSNEEILNSLQKYLPPKNLSENYLESIIKKYLNPNFIKIDLEDESDFKDFTNPMRLYYKIHRTFNLSKEHNIYDLYIRVRPDIITHNTNIDLYDIHEQLLNSNKIFSHYSYVLDFYGFGVDDKLAISKYRNMEIYSNTWVRDYAIKNKMAGHINLANNLFFHSIDVEKIADLQIRFANYNLLTNSSSSLNKDI